MCLSDDRRIFYCVFPACRCSNSLRVSYHRLPRYSHDLLIHGTLLMMLGVLGLWYEVSLLNVWLLMHHVLLTHHGLLILLLTHHWLLIVLLTHHRQLTHHRLMTHHRLLNHHRLLPYHGLLAHHRLLMKILALRVLMRRILSLRLRVLTWRILALWVLTRRIIALRVLTCRILTLGWHSVSRWLSLHLIYSYEL